jgi:NAD(P)-dependent dehydrogenase (short-subunit alcohol dehydrogenase family)
MKARVALVSGGGRGIGREAALLLAAAGARVMVVSRSATELAAVGLEYVVADLGTTEGCARAVAETERRLGPIDLLVVNHGIGSAHERLVWEQDPEVWRETMRVNLDGPFELARLTVGGMCQRGFGRLVFTSSTAGEKAERSGSAYTASKHGVIGLARAIAQDAGPFGVTSNAVLPGWVRTAMAERSAQTEAERRGISVDAVWRERAAIYPQNRVLEPREVAQVIAFLCSEAAGGVNGEAITVALGGILVAMLLTHRNKSATSLKGAVIKQDSDTKKELPIAQVQITAESGFSAGDCKSDSSGFFDLKLAQGVEPGSSVTLRFRHPDYLPLDLNELVGDKLYVARMVPGPRQSPTEPSRREIVVANVLARYSIKATTAVNIGSAVKTFQVVNTGNLPCNGRQPCSPDGRWKAAIGSASLDAGEGSEFQNARASCIAGPCPFTKIESDGFSRGGRTIYVSARNWSDTTTFL